MATLQQLQLPIDHAICNAMVESTPDHWTSIVLKLWREREKTAIGQLMHELTSPEGHAPVAPVDGLYDATYNLDALLQEHGGLIASATYSVQLNEQGLRYQVKFEYYDSPKAGATSGSATAPASQPAATSESAAKPWYKRLFGN